MKLSEDQYIKERLQDQIRWYGRKSAINKKWYHRFQIAQFILAALITLSVAVDLGTSSFTRIIVPSMGAAITVITGLLGTYKFHEKWLEYRTTTESLKHEKYLYLTKCPPYDGQSAFVNLVERVERLISQENSKWEESMQQNTGKSQ